MTTIRIKRPDDWMNSARYIRIYLDDKKIGIIPNNETKEFEIQPGQHKIKARIDWCGSKNLYCDIKKDETKEITVSGLKSPRYLLAFLLILFGLPTLINIYFNADYRILTNICIGLSFAIVSSFLYFLGIKRNSYLTISEKTKNEK